MGYFWGWGRAQKIVFGSIHVVEQLSFCMFSSIFIFDFYLILGSFLNLVALMGYFWGWKTVLGSTHIVEQHLF